LLELGYPGTFAAEPSFAIVPVEVPPGSSTRCGRLLLRTARSQHSVANFAVRIEDGDSVLCFSGDGAPTEETRMLYRGANVLVHECYRMRPGTYGHAHLQEVVDVAVGAKVKTLCIVHVGADAQVEVRSAASRVRGPLRIVLPAPGDFLTL
jgi:ribonuclease BN (tRNA processing enzyme)